MNKSIFFEIIGFDNKSTKTILENIASEFLVKISLNPDGLSVNGQEKNINEFLIYVENLFQNKLIYGDICSILKKRLIQNNYTLSVAESFTGGEISSLLTKIDGISEVFLGGLTAYSVQSKINILGVKEEIIKEFGVYSIECVKHMATKAREIFKSNISISTSGLASIDTSKNNISNYPAGKGFICISIEGRLPIVVEENFSGSREEIIKSSSIFAIKLLLKHI